MRIPTVIIPSFLLASSAWSQCLCMGLHPIPVNPVVMEGTPVTFLLFNPGCSGITGYQWQRWQGNDWINIPGADSTFYTITPLLADSGAQFRVWVDRSPCVSLASLATTL